MKKSILVMLLVVIVATPCLAQEIEPDGLFSIAGTEWRRIGVKIIWRPSYTSEPFISLYDETVYFTDRSIETSTGNIGILQYAFPYLDFLVFSVAWSQLFEIMVLQPTLGVGMFSFIDYVGAGYPTIIIPIGVAFGFMFKIDDDDWTPPEDE